MGVGSNETLELLIPSRYIFQSFKAGRGGVAWQGGAGPGGEGRGRAGQGAISATETLGEELL